MNILVVNAGSTSVKLRVVAEDGTAVAGAELGSGGEVGPTLDDVKGRHGPLLGVAHRIVHGGPRFAGPVLIDDRVRAELEELNDLAPLHNPPALHIVDRIAELDGGLVQAASFDTAFHHLLPPEASTYALPSAWVSRWHLRRYGFHGLSVAWATRRAAQLLDRPVEDLRLVVCHLGGGASVTAVDGGRSVDTSMGFTPADGLIMATRAGSVDPGLVAWLAQHDIDGAELAEALERRSGLLALTDGRTGDLRVLLEDRRTGDRPAAFAVAAYIHRLTGTVASMLATTAGADAIVFTGGVGEHAAEVRAEAVERLAWVGGRLDAGANDSVGDEDADISAEGSSPRILVVHAREELIAAEECRPLLVSRAT